MKIGLFTPIHKFDKEQLDLLTKSIKHQARQPDEWVILVNGGMARAMIEVFIKYFEDIPYARVYQTETDHNVGQLKKECCSMLEGLGVDMAVELDYDDALRYDALYLLEQRADENPEAVFFFSNFAHFEYKDNGGFESLFYSDVYGWKRKEHFDETLFEGHMLNELVSFPATPQFLNRIEASPNHMRAFRLVPYNKIDGYSPLMVGDDHDLMCRFFIEYGEKGFHHIDECLYYQRIGNTTTRIKNKEIQDQVHLNYLKYMEAMFKKWSKDNRLGMLDLGGRFNCPKDYTSVDLQDADLIIDLNGPWGEALPKTNYWNSKAQTVEDTHKLLPSNSYGIIRAYHLLEHLADPIHFFNEAYRLLAPGGLLLIEVPSLNHPSAFADPTHKSFWSTLNFQYYVNEYKARFIRPSYKGAFLPLRVAEYAWEDGTLVITAQLTALKGWYNQTFWGHKQTDEKYIDNGY